MITNVYYTNVPHDDSLVVHSRMPQNDQLSARSGFMLSNIREVDLHHTKEATKVKSSHLVETYIYSIND